MKIKALLPFTLQDSEKNLISVACGAVVDVTSELGASLISDGLAEEYTLITPTGTKSITENGENIDVAEYAKANVNVAQPTGKIEITANGTDIDVSQYATADVSVPNPSTGTLPITANNIYDVTQYASVDVNVAGSLQYREFYITINNSQSSPIDNLSDIKIPTVREDGMGGYFFQGQALEVVDYFQRTKVKLPIIDGACRIMFSEEYYDEVSQGSLGIKFTLDPNSTNCSYIDMDGFEGCLVVTADNAEVILIAEAYL